MADAASPDVLSSLSLALLNVMAIVALGNAMARVRACPPSTASCIGCFAAKVALPSLLFRGMASLDFSTVEWPFLIAVWGGKTIVFLVAAAISYSLARHSQGRASALKLAGLRGIYVTQSNDFALGLPIVKAMFGVSNPSFEKFFYLTGPLQLCWLNVIGFGLLEAGRSLEQRSGGSGGGGSGGGGGSRGALAFSIAVGVLKNPVVSMTLAGVAWNLALGEGSLPGVLDTFFGTLGASFDAVALFTLGYSMAGPPPPPRQLPPLPPAAAAAPTAEGGAGGGVESEGEAEAVGQRMRAGTAQTGLGAQGEGQTLPPPPPPPPASSAGRIGLMLNAAKIVLLPLIIKLLIDMQGGSSALSLFGFIYGCLPTAPSVLMFAQVYDVRPDVRLIPGATVAGTVLSAPIMLATALLAQASNFRPDEFQTRYFYRDVTQPSLYFGGVAAAGTLWVGVGLAHRWWVLKRGGTLDDEAMKQPWPASRRFVWCLVVTQGAFPIASFMCAGADAADTSVLADIIFVFIFGAILSNRLWLVACAVELHLVTAGARAASLLRRWRSRRVTAAVHAVCWGGPLLLSLALLFAAEQITDKFTPNTCWFRFGTAQWGSAAVVVTFSLAACACALIFYGRAKHARAVAQGAAHTAASDAKASTPGAVANPTAVGLQTAATADAAATPMTSNPGVEEGEGVALRASLQFAEDYGSSSSSSSSSGGGGATASGEPQLDPGTESLLLYNILSCTCGLFVTLAGVVDFGRSSATGAVRIELTVVDSVMNYSFGIMTFVAYGRHPAITSLHRAAARRAKRAWQQCTVCMSVNQRTAVVMRHGIDSIASPSLEDERLLQAAARGGTDNSGASTLRARLPQSRDTSRSRTHA